MNLVRAELGRLAARRFVQLMLVLLVAAFSITVATTLAGSHRPTTGEIAAAEAQAAQRRQQEQQWYDDCLAGSSESPRAANVCRNFDPEGIDASNFLVGVFVFEHEVKSLVYFLVAFLTLFGFLVGASFVGAELTSGGMTNLLLWWPRRTTVLGTKLGTLLGAVLAISVVAGAAYLAAFRVVAQVAGLPGQLDGGFWRELGVVGVRGLALALGATALGFALATLGRHTSAAVGVAAGYAIVWEIGGRIVMNVIDAARPDQWMLSTHVVAWMAGELEMWDNTACQTCDGRYTLTWLHALVVLVAVLVPATAAAFATFRRRDLA